MSNQLRWIAMAVTASVATLATGQAAAQNYGNSDYGHGNGYGHSRIVRCESTNSRRTWCRVDTGGGVRIARQLSHTPCIEGSSWGSNDRGVWVSNGCRADFAVRSGHDHDHRDGYSDNNGYGNRDSHYVDSSVQVLQCDSTGDGRTYCHSEPNRRFLLSRSRAGNCVEGQTWGMDERGLWVSGGCRGDFSYQR